MQPLEITLCLLCKEYVIYCFDPNFAANRIQYADKMKSTKKALCKSRKPNVSIQFHNLPNKLYHSEKLVSYINKNFKFVIQKYEVFREESDTFVRVFNESTCLVNVINVSYFCRCIVTARLEKILQMKD